MRQIVDSSRQANAQKSIGGVLAYSETRFAQLLEGPTASVDALYEKIRSDSRHTDVIPIARVTCDRRIFRNWSMAAFDPESGQDELFEAIVNSNGRHTEPIFRIVADLIGTYLSTDP
jgi:hypothetical protein